MEDKGIADKTDLIQQKEIIENRIKRFERRHVDEKIKDSLGKLGEVNDAISDMQLSLNLIWKRTKQIEEELKDSLELS